MEKINKTIANPKFEDLKNKIEKISNESMKIEFMSLAYDSLSNRKALDELKLLLKGIELTLNV